jgi:HEAT repeat protein
MIENVSPKGKGRRDVYELLTGKIAPFASEGDSLRFDQIVRAPVDDETVGLVAECLVDEDPATRRAGLFIFAGLQDETAGRLDPFRPLERKIRELLLDLDPSVRCDALMAFAYFDPEDLHTALREFLTDPHGRNRLQAVRILDAEANPVNLPTLLTLGVDPYHEESLEDTREWLVVREAARQAIERTAHVRLPAPLAEEEVEGVPCVFHAWDPVWQWAARTGVRRKG